MKTYRSTIVSHALVIGCALSPLACGGPEADDTLEAKTPDNRRPVAAPAFALSCTDVCTKVATCGIAPATCQQVCPSLPLACQGCLAKIPSCSSTECDALCGAIGSGSTTRQPVPTPGAKCDPITFDFSTITPNANEAANEGASCTVPWDCRAQACVSGKVNGPPVQSVSFCASPQPCNEPDASGEPYQCPTGWGCAQVAEFQSAGSTMRWTCVPPAVTPCQPGQLQY